MVAAATWGVSWAGAFTVDQKDIAFSVPTLSVKKGDIVTFTNSDQTAHNLLIVGGGSTINSGLQQPGVPFKVPFLKSGSYQVTCGIHPRMKMTVVVE
jgi:cytochrome c peroxidase